MNSRMIARYRAFLNKPNHKEIAENFKKEKYELEKKFKPSKKLPRILYFVPTVIFLMSMLIAMTFQELELILAPITAIELIAIFICIFWGRNISRKRDNKAYKSFIESSEYKEIVEKYVNMGYVELTFKSCYDLDDEYDKVCSVDRHRLSREEINNCCGDCRCVNCKKLLDALYDD